jgi:hypothetical protein
MQSRFPGISNLTLESLQAELKHLDARFPMGMNGWIGGESFQSRADILLFMEKYVPSNSFFLFHDAVTLLESLLNLHVEHKDVLQEWYQSSKVGENEAWARHMASFWLTIPTVFGRIKGGSTLTLTCHQIFQRLEHFRWGVWYQRIYHLRNG